MGSETSVKIPIIDFSESDDLKRGSPNWESVAIQVTKALEEFGCFEAKLLTDQVPPHLRKSLFDSLKQLFNLPTDTKLRSLPSLDKPYYSGYGPKNHIFRLYEAFGITDIRSPGTIQTFANLMWPSHGNPTFSKSVESISEQVSELDKIVRTMVLEKLGVEKYLDELFDSTTQIFRVQKYDAPEDDESEIALLSHMDSNFLTILYQDDVNGLEVLAKDGQYWIDVQPSSPHSFIVMIGEAFHAWTNGRVHAAYHRVRMRRDDEKVVRYSMGLFTAPKSGYVIKAREELVDEEEHPLLFNPYDYDQYYKFISSSDTKAPWSITLKDYCGTEYSTNFN